MVTFYLIDFLDELDPSEYLLKNVKKNLEWAGKNPDFFLNEPFPYTITKIACNKSDNYLRFLIYVGLLEIADQI